MVKTVTAPLVATTADETKSQSIPNKARLRAHLAKDGLSIALLEAWETGDSAQVKSRMLAALDKFASPQPVAGHDSPF